MKSKQEIADRLEAVNARMREIDVKRDELKEELRALEKERNVLTYAQEATDMPREKIEALIMAAGIESTTRVGELKT